MLRAALRDDFLLAVFDADDAAAGVRHPEGAVRFREDAFGPLEVVTDVPEGVSVDAEIQNRIRAGDLGPPHPILPLVRVLEPEELYHRAAQQIIDYFLTALSTVDR